MEHLTNNFLVPETGAVSRIFIGGDFSFFPVKFTTVKIPTHVDVPEQPPYYHMKYEKNTGCLGCTGDYPPWN